MEYHGYIRVTYRSPSGKVTDITAGSNNPRPKLFRASWRELHGHNPEERSAEENATWLKAYTMRIPSFQCDCRGSFRQYVKNNPPDFTSRAGFFAWSVAAHNDVNNRLGKPVVALAEALATWKPGSVDTGPIA